MNKKNYKLTYTVPELKIFSIGTQGLCTSPGSEANQTNEPAQYCHNNGGSAQYCTGGTIQLANPLCVHGYKNLNMGCSSGTGGMYVNGCFTTGNNPE